MVAKAIRRPTYTTKRMYVAISTPIESKTTSGARSGNISPVFGSRASCRSAFALATASDGGATSSSSSPSSAMKRATSF